MNYSFYTSLSYIFCSNYHLFCIGASFIFYGLIIYLIRFYHLFVFIVCIYIFFRIFNYQLIGYGSVYICSVYFVLYFVRFQYSFCISRLFILYIYYQFVGFGSAVHVEASMISLAISLGRVYLRYSANT